MNVKNLLRKKWIRMLQDAVMAWWNDQAPSKGAALAYYSMFSIAPLLFLVIAIAGLFFGEDAVRGAVFGQVSALMGENGAEAIQEMLAHVSEPKTGGFAAALSIAVLLFGASTVFGQLQSALDTIWRVPEGERKGKAQRPVDLCSRPPAHVRHGPGACLRGHRVTGAQRRTRGAGKMVGRRSSANGKRVAHVFDLAGELRRPDRGVRGNLQAHAPRQHQVAGRVGRRRFHGDTFRHRQVPHRPVSRQEQHRLELRRLRLAGHRHGVDLLLGADFSSRREFTWVYAHEAGSRRGAARQKNNLAEVAPAPAHVAAPVPPAPVVIRRAASRAPPAQAKERLRRRGRCGVPRRRRAATSHCRAEAKYAV